MSIWDDDLDTADESATTPRREGSGGRLVFVLIVVLALLAGGGYAAAYYLAGDNVPEGTTVGGVDIGGRDEAEAVTLLRGALSEQAAAPIEVLVDGKPTTIDPVEAGIGIDYDASVAAAGAGASWDPKRLWDYYTDGDDLDPVLDVDDAALEDAVAALEAETGTAPRNGAVRFDGPRVVVRQPREGRGLEPESTREALLSAFLDAEPADLSTVAVAPEIDEDDVAEAVDSFANPAVSGPVTLKFGTSRVRLAPRDYVEALSLVATDGRLVPAVDQDVVLDLVDEATAGKGDPVDATVRLVDGKPQVVPSKPGVSFDPADIEETFLALVSAPDGKRNVRVPATVERAEFTTKMARALGVKEKVSEFTTNFPYAEYRNINIGRAAELVDGTLLKPGEIFSMNDIVGERTRESGFTEGFIISNGIFKEDLGGGVSQMATTLFNAMFFAGLEDIEHKPHSFYIDRYPVGREATVAFGAIDLRFRNDTDYGVLVNAEVIPATPSSQGVVTVRMYSTKIWDITTTTSGRYNATQPETRTLRTEDCYPNNGYAGFTIDVKRIFTKVGEDEVDHVENFKTVYTPSDSVVCKPPPRESDSSQ